MSGLSINDILHKIDARLEDLRLTDESVPIVSLDPLSEVGLYITSDRLLADLYRQYLEAQRHYITSIETHGKDAPMTEIASDMADSSFCAMETRLIELREEKGMADRVARMQAQQRDKYVEEMQSRQAEHARRGIKQPQAMDRAQVANRNMNQHNNMDMGFWALFAMSFLSQEEHNEPVQKHTLSEFTRVAA